MGWLEATTIFDEVEVSTIIALPPVGTYCMSSDFFFAFIHFTIVFQPYNTMALTCCFAFSTVHCIVNTIPGILLFYSFSCQKVTFRWGIHFIITFFGTRCTTLCVYAQFLSNIGYGMFWLLSHISPLTDVIFRFERFFSKRFLLLWLITLTKVLSINGWSMIINFRKNSCLVAHDDDDPRMK